jgi:hypothetical protein
VLALLQTFLAVLELDTPRFGRVILVVADNVCGVCVGIICVERVAIAVVEAVGSAVGAGRHLKGGG